MQRSDTAIEILDTRPGAILEHSDTRPLDWSPILEAWKRTLKSERTKQEYGRYVSQFADLMADTGRGLEDATAPDVQAFAYARLENPRTGAPGVTPSPAAINLRMAAIRSLYAFVIRLQGWHGPTIIADNPADSRYVKRPPLPPPSPKGLALEDVRTILKEARNRPDKGPRDYAILLTLFLTGMRRTELLRLTAGSIAPDDDGRIMYRVIVKGGHERYREMPRDAYRAILEYLEAAGTPLEAMPDDARIFPISSGGLYAIVNRYGKLVGHDGLGVHALRHTAAKLQRRAGAPLEDVQAFLGHKSVATTARYIALLEGEADTYGADVYRMIEGVTE